MRTILALAALLAAILPGAVSAAPADQADAAVAAQTSGLFIQSDFVAGAPLCFPQGRFHPGERVVFRAKVFDAQTGEVVPTADVVVRFEDGFTIPMRFGTHPPPNVGPPADDYWVGVWAIRPDAPMGVVRYTIEATDGARTGHFEPFTYDQSRLTVVPADS